MLAENVSSPVPSSVCPSRVRRGWRRLRRKQRGHRRNESHARCPAPDRRQGHAGPCLRHGNAVHRDRRRRPLRVAFDSRQGVGAREAVSQGDSGIRARVPAQRRVRRPGRLRAGAEDNLMSSPSSDWHRRPLGTLNLDEISCARSACVAVGKAGAWFARLNTGAELAGCSRLCDTARSACLPARPSWTHARAHC